MILSIVNVKFTVPVIQDNDSIIALFTVFVLLNAHMHVHLVDQLS